MASCALNPPGVVAQSRDQTSWTATCCLSPITVLHQFIPKMVDFSGPDYNHNDSEHRAILHRRDVDTDFLALKRSAYTLLAVGFVWSARRQFKDPRASFARAVRPVLIPFTPGFGLALIHDDVMCSRMLGDVSPGGSLNSLISVMIRTTG